MRATQFFQVFPIPLKTLPKNYQQATYKTAPVQVAYIERNYRAEPPVSVVSSSLLRDCRLSAREKGPFLAGKAPTGTKQGRLQPLPGDCLVMVI